MLEKIVNFLFPTTCLFCKTGGKSVCEKCFLEIPKNPRWHNKNNFDLDILSVYEFKNEKVNKLLWRLKYHHTGEIAKLFGKSLAEEIKSEIVKKTYLNFIFLIPIPLSAGDKRIHNHASLIAESIKENFYPPESPGVKIKVLDNLLIKNSKKKQAHTKDKKERFENIKDTFKITSPFLEGGQKGTNNSMFILIDDVTTTGATLSEAKKVLVENFKIQSDQIFAITVAY